MLARRVVISPESVTPEVSALLVARGQCRTLAERVLLDAEVDTLLAVRNRREMAELKQLLSELPDESAPAGKTFSELLAEGHAHKGGLAQLAALEKAGTLFEGVRLASEPSNTPAQSAIPTASVRPEDGAAGSRAAERAAADQRWKAAVSCEGLRKPEDDRNMMVLGYVALFCLIGAIEAFHSGHIILFGVLANVVMWIAPCWAFDKLGLDQRLPPLRRTD
jgi:hypothetical protein